MQVLLKTFDEFLEEQTIFKVYKDLENIILLSNANILSLYQGKDFAIKLDIRQTLMFDLLYNLLKYQLKTLYKYM